MGTIARYPIYKQYTKLPLGEGKWVKKGKLPPMDSQSSRYKSYLLTIWKEMGEDQPPEPGWRFSLEDPHTGKRRGFSNPQALVQTLIEEMERLGALSRTKKKANEAERKSERR